MKRLLTEEENYFFEIEAKKVVNHKMYRLLDTFIHHHGITTYEHAISVAFLVYKKAILKRKKVDIVSLIRGALLHDFYLYDWHIKSERKWHGFKHSVIAFKNAKKYFEINSIEKDIIVSHMWPLNRRFPKTKEGRMVTFADKKCSFFEIFRSEKYKYKYIDRLKI